MKIQFNAYRDRSAGRTSATQRQLTDLAERERQLKAQLKPAVAKGAAPVIDPTDTLVQRDLGALDVSRASVLAVEEDAAKKALDDALLHPLVGKFGYQEIDDAGEVVLAIKDEDGNVLPDDAVYEYEIVDSKPEMPKWGTPPIGGAQPAQGVRQ